MIWLSLAGLVLRIILSLQIYSGDINNHISWGMDILANGAAGVYERSFTPRYGTLNPTYPPIPLLLFTLSQFTYDQVYQASDWANSSFGLFPSRVIWFLQAQNTLPAFYKIWAMLADIGIAWLIYTATRARWLAALVLFNPAFFYNSASWGQIEAVPLFFLISAFLTRRPFLSALSFTLALLSKQSSIIFIPIYMWFFWRQFGFVLSLKSAAIGIAVFWLSFLPFYKSGNLLTFPFATYWNKIQTGSGSNYVVDHAFNFWALNPVLNKTTDPSIFAFNLSYSFWGYLFFGSCLIFIITRKPFSIFPAATLTTLSAFFFLTRMHERYLLPALAFMVFWVYRDRRLLPVFIYLSLFHWLNLYHNWWYPRWPALVSLLTPAINIQIITLLAIVSFIWLLWRYRHHRM